MALHATATGAESAFDISVLKTLLPVATPAVDIRFGAGTAESWEIDDHLALLKELSKRLPGQIKAPARPGARPDILSEAERSGILALHAFLREKDPNHERLGLTRVPTYTGDFRWLCRKHYKEWEPKIPDKIE